ncbi:hypothetical protein HZ989_13810 [Brevundimonas sp. AJA228-03]|uniref:hypothetical protein n=1 Tax=Brevundimonas sp. AJA228-03 TaxID=2752515 RepID=UPI001ADF4B05|nr:hypothetical protein [Brevundimonas sp. AJA228-03]QTN19278.1 hypothetical protein HZ989_13810 [Brevundimonas sp. AJA228-03]
MNDRDKNLQHAMMSFALWGGMLVNTRAPRTDDRVVSQRSNFVPFRFDRKD